MKTSLYIPALAMAAGWAGLSFASTGYAADAKAAAPSYDNYVDVAAGTTSLHGDRASFQKLNDQNKTGWGGLSGFHYGQDLSKDTSVSVDGHVLGGNDDIKLDLKLIRENVGYVSVGYTQFRTWYDGNGGYFPPNGYFPQLYGDALHIDRSDLWVEVGITPPDKVNFNFRYDFITRKGLKDSTEWADTNNTAGLGTRSIVPTFLRIDEHRHVFSAKASQETEQTSWEFTGRYETSKQDNDREIHRTPASTTDRYQTQVDGSNNDMFMVRGSAETKIGETLSMSTGMAHYDLDTNISGSRIGGNTYDPVFNPTYTNRQWHDEGFYNLEGTAHMAETLANINLMYTPTENWTIVPSLLAQKTRWGANAGFVETAVGNAPTFATTTEDLENESNKEFRSLKELVEFHYTGFKNVALNSNLELEQGYGNLSEDQIEAELGEIGLNRATDYRRDAQKYDFTAHWYVQPGLSITGQYYWKGRQNAFVNTADSVSAAPTSGDRYPGYISHQNYETNDFNVRASWAPFLSVHTVTRYDYQQTKIKTQEIGLAFIDSANVKTHVISETVTWNPLDRWYVQGSGSLVYDRLTTPASALTGAAAGLVLNSDNNYWNYDLATGYAVDQDTDLSVSYSYYRADNYVDNSARSVPYGAGFTNQLLSLTWFRRISPNLNYTVRYAYGDFADANSGGYNSYRAHMVYGKVQYRF